MKQKIMLIAGCSHTAGSEIDGNIDSLYNRQNSYGNLLAKSLGYTPINIAVAGFTNSAIARSVLEWFSTQNLDDKEVFVLIGWTECARVEAPFEYPTFHNETNAKDADWFSNTSINFLQINVGHKNFSEREKDIQSDYQNFIVRRTEYLEMVSANLVLQLQYFLKYKEVKYLMLNTSHMFSSEYNKYLQFYLQLIDKTNYYNFNNNKLSFFHKFKELGFKNFKAKYAHHNEEPHKLYARELYRFIMEKK